MLEDDGTIEVKKQKQKQRKKKLGRVRRNGISGKVAKGYGLSF